MLYQVSRWNLRKVQLFAEEPMEYWGREKGSKAEGEISERNSLDSSKKVPRGDDPCGPCRQTIAEFVFDSDVLVVRSYFFHLATPMPTPEREEVQPLEHRTALISLRFLAFAYPVGCWEIRRPSRCGLANWLKRLANPLRSWIVQRNIEGAVAKTRLAEGGT